MVSCWLALIAGIAGAEDYQGRIAKMLNLGTPITVERFQNGTDEVDLWVEGDDLGQGVAKNWGVFYYSSGKYVDSWFYTGPLTNVFRKFYVSYHNFTKDSIKEVALVGEKASGDGMTRIFIFNLAKKKLQLLYQCDDDMRGTTLQAQPEKACKQGFYRDLNKDQVEELLVYRELKGTFLQSVYWTDIYSLKETAPTLVNKYYPTFYSGIQKTLEKIALDEFKLPDGNHRVFYEHLARVYDYLNKPADAAVAREKANVPAARMGEKMLAALHAKGYKAYQMMRADIDGISPLDALIWARGDGKKDQFWIICSANDIIKEAQVVPLPQEFFTASGEIVYDVKNTQLWFCRKPTTTKSGVAYLYTYQSNGTLVLAGTEELRLQKGQTLRVVTGQAFDGYGMPNEKITYTQAAFLKASPCAVLPMLDGVGNETEWQNAQGVVIASKEQIVQGIREQWKGADDISFSVKSLYRGNTLYFFIKVKDDSRIFWDTNWLESNTATDHVEIYLMEKEKIYRYGIFILPTSTLVWEMVGSELRKPALQMRAQWMPAIDGYWLEVEIPGLTLTGETYPVTLAVTDTDNLSDPAQKLVMATSAVDTTNRQSLSSIRLR